MFNKAKLLFLVLMLLLAALVAPTFALNVAVSGVLDGFDNPSDEYSIYIEAGEIIGISHICIRGQLDPEVDVFGPNGFYRNDDDDGSIDCAQGSSSHLGFTAPTSGVYVIVASSYEIISDNDPSDQNANGVYTLVINGNFTPLFDYNPDGRLNHGYGDLYAVLYSVQDSAGQPAIDVYCFTGETWTVTLSVTAGSGNTSANGCAVDVYALADGAYQFNINTDGKLYSLICSDLSCAAPVSSYFDPNE